MKKIIGIISLILIIIVVVYWISSQGDWHLKRNRYNILPTGHLKLNDGQYYTDEALVVWELQPHTKNIFHQPDVTPAPPGVPIPYPNISPQLKYDPDHPNLKFLSMDGKGGSCEAILQPDGTYLITGPKQGTYNYSNPEGILGYFKHAVFDVMPHFFNSNYDDSLNQSASHE